MAEFVFADRKAQSRGLEMVSSSTWEALSEAAWEARSNARLIGNVHVGAAVLTTAGDIFRGCNLEHKFRCHDVHAEVNALSSMVAGGQREARAILVAAEESKFTPCGSCLDWIMELGGSECLVAYQNLRSGPIHVFSAAELMPHYPAS